MLEVAGITKSYGDFVALRGLSIEVERGEIVALAGENGAGKSTALRIIAGVIKPDSGSVRLDGVEVSKSKERIGYLPEHDALYDNMTAEEYLRFFAMLYGVKNAGRVRNLMREFEVPDRLCSELSKGNRRKLSIARTLIHDPDLLVYDEPMSGLDPVMSLKVAEKMVELAENGKMIVFSTHNLYYVERIADRIAILKGGEVLYYGAVDEILVESGYAIEYELNGSRRSLEVESVEELVKALNDVLRNDGKILDVKKLAPRLEDVYFSLVKFQN